ncbi:MAG: HD domain-containing protein [Bacilli bacterium]|nr:HD domain-containing protein [Bacilli bacterium]
MFCVFVVVKRKFVSAFFTAMYLAILFTNLAYLLGTMATSVDGYIVGLKVNYLGNVLMPIITFLIICDFIKLKHMKLTSAIVALVGGLYLILPLSVGFSNLYYKELAVEIVDGVQIVTKVYGPLHAFYYVYNIGYIFLDLAFLIHGFSKKNVSYKNFLYLTGLISFTIVAALLGRLLKINVESIPVTYCVSGFIMLFLVIRISRYNVQFMGEASQNNDEHYGYFAIDHSNRYLGSSPDIEKDFPEFLQLWVDRKLTDDEVFRLTRNLVDGFKKGNTDAFEMVERNNKIYKLTISKFDYSRREDDGYVISIHDDSRDAKLNQFLENYSNELSHEVELKTLNIKTIQDKIVLGMADLVETKDQNTGGHVKRTSDIIKIIISSIKELNAYEMDDEFFSYVRRAAPMHDLGKMMISDDILNKPGKFTPEEFEIMKTHPVIGEKVVSALLEGVENERFVKIAKNVAKYHHEKYGGGGYPENLSGDDIPLEARIMALADVYDALVSKRCYKEKMSYDKARDIILESMGPHFDPKLKEVFMHCKEDLEKYYDSAD